MRNRTFTGPFSLIVMAIAMVMIPAGCVVLDDVESTSPTVGQELMDLKKARDDGAISETEYQDQRQKLLN